MGQHERKRKVERIPIGAPITGRVGGMPVLIRDVSVLGCRLEHEAPLKPNVPVRIEFSWNGTDVALGAEVVRCTLTPPDAREAGAPPYTSGTRFIDANSEAARTLRTVIQMQIEQAFEEQLANARGDLPEYLRRIAMLPGMNQDLLAVRKQNEFSTLLPWLRFARSRGYVRWSWDGRKWKRQRTSDPEQPDDGFTIWAWEGDEQIRLLQDAYEQSTQQFRSIIRLCAELSLIVDDTIPPQKFLPSG